MPDFGGLPGSGGFTPPAAPAPGVNQAPTGTGVPSTPPSNEAIGSNPGSVPVNMGSNGPSPSGSGGASGAMASGPAPGTAAGGSAMTGGGGVGGSAMTGGAAPGTGAGGNGTPPPPVATPPQVGAGCDSGEIFCEDFDGINVGPLQGTVNGMRVDRAADIVEEAGRGRVLRVQAGTGYDTKGGVFLDDFAPPNNSFFGRAFVRIDQFPTAGGDHWVVVEATNNGTGEQVRPVGGQFSRWAPGSDGPSAGDWTDWAESDAATTAGAWECIEWQIDGANGANDMLLWVNGVEVQPLDRGNFQLPAINRLWLGFVVFQTGQPPMHEIRFDDIVLSTQQVGCN